MEIIKIVGAAVCAAVLCVSLKDRVPAFAAIIALAASAIILITVMPKLAAVLDMLNLFSERLGEGSKYMGAVVKIIGVAYCAEFGAGVCEDAGEKGLAAKVNIAGKFMILAVAAPIVLSMLDTVISIAG